ncbi:hypothetical protein LINGRAHAP2_LOCUS32606 [Linum grandiflorum]
MDVSKLDQFMARFDGKNFPLWEFQFSNYVRGKRLLPILDGTRKKPNASDAKEFANWDADNAHVITWIIAYVDASTGLSLRRFETAVEMWTHLRNTYLQADSSRQLRLNTNSPSSNKEIGISDLTIRHQFTQVN